MKMFLMFLLLAACNISYDQQPQVPNNDTERKGPDLINSKGKNIAERINLPQGYHRTTESAASFVAYLRNIPLKPHLTPVRLYNGDLKSDQSAHAAVLDVSVGDKDLQQCADAVIRLRADYLRSEKRYDDIFFNFTNGFKASYSAWRSGKSIQVQQNTCKWVPSTYANAGDESYSLYLQKVFSYAGSLSLSRQLIPVSDLSTLQAGDVWIRGGSPGHAAIVMDVAINNAGEKIFLLAQSYMPAQDIHILKNPMNGNISPWYAVNEIKLELETPEYTFHKSELARW